MLINKQSISYFAAILARIEKGEPIMRKPHDHADCLAHIAHSKAAADGSLGHGCYCEPEWHGLADDFCICAIQDAIPLDFCPECDSMIDSQWDPDHIIMMDSSDAFFIAQCCEGYQPIAI